MWNSQHFLENFKNKYWLKYTTKNAVTFWILFDNFHKNCWKFEHYQGYNKDLDQGSQNGGILKILGSHIVLTF